MFRKIFPILVFILIMFSSVSLVKAQTFGLKATGDKAQYDTANTNIYSTISTIIGVGLSMAGLVFLAIMFYGGLRWMTARGDDEKATKAKNAIFEAIIGFVLVTVSYGISTFVFQALIK